MSDFLRHTLATLAYRGAKAIRGAPRNFEVFRPTPDARTPCEILAHIGDLLDWALELSNGRHAWRGSTPLDWENETERFFAALEALDQRLASEVPLSMEAQKLFQAPVADALTHVGQIAMLRRLAGSPIRGENYLVAKIEKGRVGADQPEPALEFD